MRLWLNLVAVTAVFVAFFLIVAKNAPGAEAVTSDPGTSASGTLAVWTATTTCSGSEDAAKTYPMALYKHVQVLTEGIRGAATNFAVPDVGQAHLTRENEALQKVTAPKGKPRIVYRPIDLLAGTDIAGIGRNVTHDGTLVPAKAYPAIPFSDAAPEMIARPGHRSYKAVGAFPVIMLIPVTEIAEGRNDGNEKVFAENGIIDTIMSNRPR